MLIALPFFSHPKPSPTLVANRPRVPWGVRFPLHRAAVEGDAEAAR